MMNKEVNIEPQNQDAYDDLIVSIEASFGRLNILIAVCDDLELREEITKRYEVEVLPIRSYRTALARQNKYTEAQVLLVNALESARLSGENHPSTAIIRKNLDTIGNG